MQQEEKLFYVKTYLIISEALSIYMPQMAVLACGIVLVLCIMKRPNYVTSESVQEDPGRY